MNLYEFMSDSPWLTFFLTWLTVHNVCGLLFRGWNRLMRHLNIRKAGRPPAHIDADGDFKPAPKIEAGQ